MLTRKDLLDIITSSNKIKAVCRSLVGSQLYKDLQQDLLVVILEYPEDKINLVKSPEGFLIKILFNLTSVNGQFFKQHLKYKSQEYKEYINVNGITPEHDDRPYLLEYTDPSFINKVIINVQKQISESYNISIDEQFILASDTIERLQHESDDLWYMANLFKLYIREGSIRKVNKLTGIPVMSIQVSIKRFKEEIKKRMQ